MESPEERNKFIMDNYDLLKKICRNQARSVQLKYPGTSLDDLIAYGFEGIIIALNKLDIDNPNWSGYISKYAYHYAVRGAKLMLGIHRMRHKNYDTNIKQRIVLMSNDELLRYMHGYTFREHRNCFKWFSEDTYIDTEYELLYLVQELPPSIERNVLCGIICNLSVRKIAQRHHISVRKVRKIIGELADIYQSIQTGETIKYLLPYKKIKCRNLLFYNRTEFKKKMKSKRVKRARKNIIKKRVGKKIRITCSDYVNKKRYLKKRKKKKLKGLSLLKQIRRIGIYI